MSKHTTYLNQMKKNAGQSGKGQLGARKQPLGHQSTMKMLQNLSKYSVNNLHKDSYVVYNKATFEFTKFNSKCLLHLLSPRKIP